MCWPEFFCLAVLFVRFKSMGKAKSLINEGKYSARNYKKVRMAHREITVDWPFF